jgi:hypothetical protein
VSKEHSNNSQQLPNVTMSITSLATPTQSLAWEQLWLLLLRQIDSGCGSAGTTQNNMDIDQDGTSKPR